MASKFTDRTLDFFDGSMEIRENHAVCVFENESPLPCVEVEVIDFVPNDVDALSNLPDPLERLQLER